MIDHPVKAGNSAREASLVLAVDEVCALLKISRASFYRRIYDPICPLRFCRFGRSIRVPKAEVERYIAEKMALEER